MGVSTVIVLALIRIFASGMSRPVVASGCFHISRSLPWASRKSWISKRKVGTTYRGPFQRSIFSGEPQNVFRSVRQVREFGCMKAASYMG